MTSHIDRQLAQLNLHDRRIREAKLSLSKYGEDIAKAKASLPHEEREIRDALVEADETIGKIRTFAEKEAAQKGEVDIQVSKQAAQIKDAARNLAKQVDDGKQNLAKWWRASLTAGENALQAFQYAVDHWKKSSFDALLDTQKRGNNLVIRAIMRSGFLMGRALEGAPVGKYKAPAFMTFSPVERFPGTEDIRAAEKNIAKVRNADQKLKKQVAEHQGRIVKAGKELQMRRDDAYRKIKDALAMRSRQLTQWTDRKKKLTQALKQQAERKEKIAAAERELAQRRGLIRRQEAQVDRAASSLRKAQRGRDNKEGT